MLNNTDCCGTPLVFSFLVRIPTVSVLCFLYFNQFIDAGVFLFAYAVTAIKPLVGLFQHWKSMLEGHDSD